MYEGMFDGGPAFPTDEENAIANIYHYEGMALRDWFAGQALAGLATLTAHSQCPGASVQAEIAYVLADAMIKERNKA